MLKNILLKTIEEIDRLEQHSTQVMKECIDKKLDRSLTYYESHLEETCKYILTRNPITIIKAMNGNPKKDKEEDISDEL